MRRIALSLVFLLALSGCTGEPPVVEESAAKIVGYFTDWGVYGRDFQVKDLETSGSADKLTHLMYAFGKVTAGRCSAADGWADYDRPIAAADSVDGVADKPDAPLRGSFGQLRKLKAKHPGLKLIWSFGGWTGSDGFTAAARDPAAFAASCHDLINDKRWAGLFDGVDVDWEYPNACGLRCDTSGPDALPRLLAALRTAFGPAAPVTAAVPADLGKLKATDYLAASRSASWLSAMTYDYFGTDGAKKTAPHSPLSAYPGIPRDTATTTATVDELLGLGVPAAKVLLGIGFYGRGWTGVDAAAPGGPASGPADGRFEKGIEDYEVLATRCPPTGTIGGTAYAHCGNQWWSYDTPTTIKAKMAYARSRSLGGAFAWELSGDTPRADLLGAVVSGLEQTEAPS
ncbi:glycoside hydrolase family 18 protein [Paractinoplanes durhamensis]|uniref:chitinase n=1 Tax=Paractinoplanes durhamensis TaxID=113563 RepID=A0ABQ3ZBK6_9ACTN|nr:glycosyl hydrolase family 18 protein [Actinoplanes durhamensis]GIE07212.1 chitinase [Actinoplanes durhamensis]